MLLAGGTAAQARAAQPADLSSGSRAALLSAADAADGSLPYDAVRTGGAAFMPYAQFRPHGHQVAMWLRFSVAPRNAQNSTPWLIVLPHAIASAELYRADGSVERTGMSVPVASRPIDASVAAFRIRASDYGSAPLLLHVTYTADVPFWTHFITERAYFARSESYRIIEGVFVGVLMAVAFLNLFLFGAMRDRSSLYYASFIVLMIANEFVSTGIGDQYIWPFAAIDVRLATYAASFLSFTAFMFFEREFLQTRTEARGCDNAILIAYGVYAVTQIVEALAPFGEHLVGALLALQLGGMIVTIVVAVVRLRSGYEPARYFVLAFVPSTVGVFANLYYDAFVPAGNSFWAANGVEIGTMLQSIVLSFSVIDRLRMLHVETHRTRSELTLVSAHAKKMQTLALFDPLTALSNRGRFTEELNRALQRRSEDGGRFAVIYCDLDSFKAINDLFGHHFGDEVLRAIATRLTASLRGGDLIARLGGDEFAVLLESIASPAQADHVSGMLEHLLDEPIVIDGTIMPIGISLGAAVFPDDGRTMDDLLHVADRRMYEMKQARKTAAS